jgi:hypothetical protein
MNESEQRFDNLRQLLKLKQHEIPPPGYFAGFSSQIISSIQEERAISRPTQTFSSPSWLTQFLSVFDSRPGLLGGLATSMVLFLVLGIVLADHSDNEISANYATDTAMQPSSPLASANVPAEMPGNDQASSGGITMSTNPVTSLQPTTSLFGQDNNYPFQLANYATAGSASH